MNILGLSCFYHDSSCCLLQDGKLVAAASEERFSRVKHDASLPVQAFRYCLKQANLIPRDLDCIAYYENPVKKTARQLAFGDLSGRNDDLSWIDPQNPTRMIREYLGFDGEILTFDHHNSHAASTYYYSGFKEAAVFTVDGVGEWTTTSYGTGNGAALSIFETVDFPHSIGLLYAAVTAFLGFKVNSGEYKVMGLAPYGKPVLVEKLKDLITMQHKGQYRLNLDYFDYLHGKEMYSPELADLLQMQPRMPESEITEEHQNLARSIQVLIEEILLEKVSYLKASTGMDNLAMAGGVALNAVANMRIRRESGFSNIFIQPAAGDAGGCLGAAALAQTKLSGERHSKIIFDSVYLGPQFSNREIKQMLAASGISAQNFHDDEDGLIKAVVKSLLANKIIGWFQGRMEFGPRALGARSIIANPMSPDMRDHINQAVKKREAFRPFAPVILFSHLTEHMDIAHHTPFMIETCRVTSKINLPAITHVDGSARPQTLMEEENPRFAKLLEVFYRASGCPILVNTSFNQRGEPIVCSPTDAIISMASTSIDALVIGDYIIDREQLPENWSDLIAAWGFDSDRKQREMDAQTIDNLYSFI